MNAKSKWYDLVLNGLLALVFLAVAAVQTANADYEYVQDGPDHNHDTYGSTEGPGELVIAVSDSDEDGDCFCFTWTAGEADGEGPESTFAYAGAWGVWFINWTWNGPPGEAPGGTLEWSQEGIGNAYAYGDNSVTIGSAARYSSRRRPKTLIRKNTMPRPSA